MIKRKELEEALESIGCKLENSYNGLNDFILNGKGDRTSFYVRDNAIQEWNTKRMFGEYSGSIRFGFEECNIEVKDGNTVSIFPENSKEVFLSFYNFKD